MAEFLDKTSLALLLYMEKHNGKMNQHEAASFPARISVSTARIGTFRT